MPPTSTSWLDLRRAMNAARDSMEAVHTLADALEVERPAPDSSESWWMSWLRHSLSAALHQSPLHREAIRWALDASEPWVAACRLQPLAHPSRQAAWAHPHTPLAAYLLASMEQAEHPHLQYGDIMAARARAHAIAQTGPGLVGFQWSIYGGMSRKQVEQAIQSLRARCEIEPKAFRSDSAIALAACPFTTDEHLHEILCSLVPVHPSESEALLDRPGLLESSEHRRALWWGALRHDASRAALLRSTPQDEFDEILAYWTMARDYAMIGVVLRDSSLEQRTHAHVTPDTLALWWQQVPTEDRPYLLGIGVNG